MTTTNVRVLAACLFVFATVACHEVRDWSRCDEKTTECRTGFVCDLAAARCVPEQDGGVDVAGLGKDASTKDGPNVPPKDGSSPDVQIVSPDVAPVKCATNDSCPSDRPLCAPSGMCVACLAEGDCKDPTRPSCVANVCVGCQAEGASACKGNTPACDATSGRCVQCTNAATHCASDPAKAFCVGNVCAGCGPAGAGACKGATPVCDATGGRCVQCTDSAAHCGSDPAKAFCVANVCSGCGAAGTGACKGAAPACDSGSGKCVQCTDAAAHCASDPTKAFCVANACVGCKAAGAGACKDKTPACADDGRCVECVSSADCKVPGKPICDVTTNTCGPCTADSQCSAKGVGPGICMFHQTEARCATDAEAIYVQRTSNCAMAVGASAGTSSTPYCTAQLGVDAVTDAKRVIVLRGPDPLTAMIVSGAAAQITVVGQTGAALEPGAAGPGIKLSSGDLYVRGVTVRRGSFEGIVADSGSTIRLNRCVVDGNSKGGIFVNGAGFDISNTVAAGNGPGDTGAGFWGGVYIVLPPAGKPARFVNNTVIQNNGGGLSCSGAVSAPGLIAFGSLNAPRDITTSCAATSCCTGDPLLTAGYRLMSGSPCIDKIPASMSAPDDIDGERRPKNGMSDCGADEF